MKAKELYEEFKKDAKAGDIVELSELDELDEIDEIDGIDEDLIYVTIEHPNRTSACLLGPIETIDGAWNMTIYDKRNGLRIASLTLTRKPTLEEVKTYLMKYERNI